MSVSYEYYKIFYYVALYQSISKASKILMSSQPNVTRVINNLEADLGCKLFLRSNKGVALTEAGEKLFLHVQTAHRHLQMGESELRQHIENKKGYVAIGFSIGITEILLHDKILPVLHDFHTQYPDVRIQIINDSTPNLIEAISEGLMDVAIITSFANDKKHIQAVLLRPFQDILIAGPSFTELRERKLYLHELPQYPLISLWKGTETYQFYNDFFASVGLPYEPEMETATTDQVLSFVANDMGIGFVSPAYARDFLASGKIFHVELAEKIPTRHISLLQNISLPLNTDAAVLTEMIMQSGSY